MTQESSCISTGVSKYPIRKDGRIKYPGRENPIITCRCGCGTVFTKYPTENGKTRWDRPREWSKGHRRRMPQKQRKPKYGGRENPIIKCGKLDCGITFQKYYTDRNGHIVWTQSRQYCCVKHAQDRKHTSEEIERMRLSQLGKKLVYKLS
jgi:hypothetical protein